MVKTKVTFLSEKKVLVETPQGDNFVVEFSSSMNYAFVDQANLPFLEFFGHLFDVHYKGDDSVIMGEINRQLMINRCASIFSYGRDKIQIRLKFGERIREIREAKGYCQLDVALNAGIELKNLVRIEEGKYSPTFDILNKIANAMGMKLDFVELNSKDNGSISDVCQ